MPRALLPECITFVAETRGDPLGAYSSLVLSSTPYNRWLTENILEHVVKRWSSEPVSVRDFAAAVVHDFEWASSRARIAFEEIIAGASTLGDPAVLAVMSVTANLQRTLGILGKVVLGGMPDERYGKTTFKLSRFWCGLIEYSPHASYFSGTMRPPNHASRLHPQRRDPLHLTSAFWCGLGDVQRACDEGVLKLREAIRRDGIMTSDDLGHLHAHAVARR